MIEDIKKEIIKAKKVFEHLNDDQVKALNIDRSDIIHDLNDIAYALGNENPDIEKITEMLNKYQNKLYNK